MQKYLIIGAGILIIFSSCQRKASYQDSSYAHYNISLKIDPERKFLKSEGSLYWPEIADTLSEISFFLHRQLQIEKLTGDRISSFEIDSLTPAGYAWLPDAAWVHVKLNRQVLPGENLEILFSYAGCITNLNPYSANAFGGEWTELGLYMPWFLQSPDLPDFTYNINVHCPESFKVSGLNEVSSKDGVWLLSSDVPVNDMVILASPSLKNHSVANDGIRIEFNYLTLSDTLVSSMTRDIQEIANWLMQRYGQVPVKTVHIVQSPRQSGGGYARMGGVVLGGLQEIDYQTYYRGYQRYFAHELAHLWWRHAPTTEWHDWINEAFAEFSALIYLRHRFGESYYLSRIEAKRTQAEGLPPLWEFDRHDRSKPDAGMIIEKNLYSKGPVLLSDLENRTGSAAFIEFSNDLLSYSSIDTDQVIVSLASVSSDSIAREFKQRLKTY